MSDLAQMRDNIQTFTDFKPLTAEERTVIEAVRVELDKLPTVPCTSCDYCIESCPENIAIPGIFEAMNLILRYGEGRKAGAGFEYLWQTKGHGRAQADACIECGVCESVCPQSIAIIDELKHADALFGANPVARR
jgi:predicted aldo/keto reductase-like oxidoreductase